MNTEKIVQPDLKAIPNGEKVVGTFSDSEMMSRLSSLRGAMERLELDAVLFTSIHNINYYSDFIYCAFGRPYGLVVTN
ncbi:MAG: aminopeptidase P family N-terminal domain-containing protein, partial [Actinomycetota bacterium]|nr:aminopeptidase P family N-terminal domain-containing protein [Actinomycetota bacterium]